MCNFFSFVVAKTGDIFYFNKEQRKSIPEGESADSHAYICSFYNIIEDKVNKYEYLKELEEDNIVFKVDKTLRSKIDYFVKNINLKELVYNSESAYYYCNEIKDDPKIRKLITNSQWAYWYCQDIKNDPKVRKLITESEWAYWYCRNIKNDPKIRKYITDSKWAFKYCLYVKDDPKVRKYVKE